MILHYILASKDDILPIWTSCNLLRISVWLFFSEYSEKDITRVYAA